MVVIDANVLIHLVTGKASQDDTARLQGLIADLSKAKSFVGIPTPALAEFLVRTDTATESLLRSMERSSALRVLPFDKRAAYQCALLNAEARKSGEKRGRGNADEPYQKVKVDRQIVAIAITNSAELIVSGDTGLINVAKAAGIAALRISELPLPAAARQHQLFGGRLMDLGGVDAAAVLPTPGADAPAENEGGEIPSANSSA